MRPDYERYGHLGVPHETQHTAAALDAAHELTKDLTRLIQTIGELLYEDDTMSVSTVLAMHTVNVTKRHLDDILTQLADLLSEHLPDDDDQDDLTADDGWHFGGVVTATPDGVVVSESDPDERDELVIYF